MYLFFVLVVKTNYEERIGTVVNSQNAKVQYASSFVIKGLKLGLIFFKAFSFKLKNFNFKRIIDFN